MKQPRVIVEGQVMFDFEITLLTVRTRSASNIEKSTSQVDKEMRGIVGQNGVPKPAYTAEEVQACSIEAMRNGGTCEACQ